MAEMEVFKDLIQTTIRRTDAKIAIELGVGKGESTGIILEALRETGGTLYSYDIIEQPVPGQKGWSYSMIGGAKGYVAWGGKPIDFLFVDTDPHDYDQTLLWCTTWFQCLKPTGVSLWHDTNLQRAGVDVRGALEAFASIKKARKVTLEFNDESYGMGEMAWR